MRILAASFMTRPSAVRALEALDGGFGTGHTRIAVLGGTGEKVGGQKPEMILAGRFTDDVIAAVRGAILELGGTVTWTSTRIGPASTRPGSRHSRGSADTPAMDWLGDHGST